MRRAIFGRTIGSLDVAVSTTRKVSLTRLASEASFLWRDELKHEVAVGARRPKPPGATSATPGCPSATRRLGDEAEPPVRLHLDADVGEPYPAPDVGVGVLLPVARARAQPFRPRAARPAVAENMPFTVGGCALQAFIAD